MRVDMRQECVGCGGESISILKIKLPSESVYKQNR